MKEMDVTWRGKQKIGTVKFDEEKVLEILKLGQPIGLCPTLRIKENGEMEVLEFSLCPVRNTTGLRLYDSD